MKLEICTTGNLHFEAKHHPIEKENHFLSTSIFGFHVNFQGVSKIAMVWNKDQNDVGVCQYVKQNSSQESRRSRWGGCAGQCRAYVKQISR